MDPVFKIVGKIEVPATDEDFVVKDYFVFPGEELTGWENDSEYADSIPEVDEYEETQRCAEGIDLAKDTQKDGGHIEESCIRFSPLLERDSNGELQLWFLEKVEKPRQKKTTICAFEVAEDFHLKITVADFSCAHKIEITLQEIYFLLKLQKQGEPGILLTARDCNNRFYIRDSQGTLRIVSVSWARHDRKTGGWFISARPYFRGTVEMGKGPQHRYFAHG